MNKLALLGFFAIIFSLGFVFAQDAEILLITDEGSTNMIYSDASLIGNGDLMINLISPSDGATFSTTSKFNVDFEFAILPLNNGPDYADMDPTSKYDLLLAPSGKIKCVVIITGESDYEISTSVLVSAGTTSVDKELSPGNYEWKVNCSDSVSKEWSSESRDFEIILIPTNTNSNNGESGGSNNNNDDESNGRRLQPIALPLENLSTDITDEEEEESRGFSAITGAVIGVIGKRGFYGIIGLLIFVAILGTYVYNKRKQEVKKTN